MSVPYERRPEEQVVHTLDCAYLGLSMSYTMGDEPRPDCTCGAVRWLEEHERERTERLGRITADLHSWTLRVEEAATELRVHALGLRAGLDCWDEFREARRQLVVVMHQDEAIVAGSARSPDSPT